jgi:GT2 family glycosyltransferase
MRHIAGATGPPPHPYDADVVILALGRADETIAAINSALAQAQVTRHVFVVDQGSRAEDLARLAAAVGSRQDATLVALDANHGVAGGRDRGIALGHGRIIAAIDNDAEFAETRSLARLVAALDADHALAAIACRIVSYQTGEDDISSWGYPLGLLSHAAESFDVATFVGGGHAIRRSAWDACGGYDEALFFCWEEYDFCLRAIARGWRIRYRGDIAIRHKVSPEDRVRWSGERWRYFVRNRLYIERKWGASWLTLVPRYGGYLVRGIRNGLLRQTLRALPAAVRLSAALPVKRLPQHALAYLRKNDGAYRGARWREALRLLPG